MRKQRKSRDQGRNRTVTLDYVFPRSLRTRPTADQIAERTAAETEKEIQKISERYQRESGTASN
jgi:hypothetical protein